jgi:hypothetical protein
MGFHAARALVVALVVGCVLGCKVPALKASVNEWNAHWACVEKSKT